MDWQLLYISLVCGLILISLLYSYCSHTTGILSSIRIYMKCFHSPPIVYICNYIYLDLYIITVYIYVYVAQMRLVMVQSITTVYRRDHINSLMIICRGTYQPHTYIQWGSLESPVPSYIPYLIYIIVINYGQQLLYIHIHTTYVYIYTIPTIYIDRYLLYALISHIYSSYRNGILNEYAYPYSRMHRTHARLFNVSSYTRDIFNSPYLRLGLIY